MPNNNNRINFQVGYNVDQASVNAVKKSLQDLQNIKFKDFNGPKKDLDDIKQKASQVEAALNKAFNVNLNSLNTQAFNAELQKAGLNIDKIYTSFSKAGAQGQVAFSRMASEVLTTNMQLKLTNSLVSQMGETMANTVKWGIASSVMNNFTNSVRQAFDYVKALDSSLNDIRIVTKQSSEEMANFAVQANNSAQALGRSTMDYTKAALTFYQQGLDEASVQARTESVLKAQNITGAGLEMADYLTAVWNGYKVANEEAELYVDKLAAVADSSASNMSLLAIAMSKVASSANLLGVPVDNLNAQIATIVATTRQAPESVGNALKTIYSRINDIATGADDAEISLGNYSAKMALVGINVLDANGRLRDTGDVIDEIGGKWETLSHEQQIYLARTMAGQRQYNNLLALFENWGKYSDLVNVSMEAQGATALKNAIYMESLSAKMEQLGAAGEKVKAALIDEDDLKGLVDFGTGTVNLFGNLILSIGGGKNAILALGSIFTQVFSGTIAKLINNLVTNFQNARSNAQLLKNDIENLKTFQNSKGGVENPAVKLMTGYLAELQKYYSVLDLASINNQKNLIRELDEVENSKIELLGKKQAVLAYAKTIEGLNLDDIWKDETLAAHILNALLGDLAGSSVNLRSLYDSFKLTGLVTLNLTKGFDQFLASYERISSNKADQLREAFAKILINPGRFTFLLLQALDDADKKTKLYSNTINTAGQEQTNLNNKTLQLKNIIENNNKSFKQLFDINNIVKAISGIGQVASGINGLINITKVWKNESLSTGEKVLQTFTSLSMSIGMLANGFKSTLPMIEVLFRSISVGTGSATVGTIMLTAATKGLSVALTLASVSAGALMTALTPLFIAGAIIAGIIATVAAIDKFTMSSKEAALAIDNFNQKQSLLSNSLTTFHLQINSLLDIKELYELLAKKAGAINFDNNIDNLTEAERTRYNLLKNLIVSYNEDVLAGYNSQHLAILLNNTEIENQILLLKKLSQIKIDEIYGGKDFLDSVKGRNKQYLDTKDNISSKLETKGVIGLGFNQLFSSVTDNQTGIRSLAGDIDLFEEELNRLEEIQRDGVLNIGKHLDELDLILLSIIEKALRNQLYQITGQAENLKEKIDELKGYEDDLAQVNGLIAIVQLLLKEKAELDIRGIIGYLQTSEQNEEYNKLTELYGLALINSIISNFAKGLDRTQGYDLISAALAIKLHLLKLLLNSQLSESEIQSYQLKQSKLLLSMAPDLTSILLYRSKIFSFISSIVNENEEFLNLLDTSPDILNTLIKSIFGFDDFSLSKDIEGDFILYFSDSTTKAYDAAKLKVEKYFKLNPIDYSSIKEAGKKQSSKLLRLSGLDLKVDVASAVEAAQTADSAVIEEFLNQSFNADLLDNIDLFLEYLDKIGVESGSVKQALDQAAEATRNYASTMSNISTFNLLQQASTGELDDLQFGQLSTELDTLVEKEIIAKDTANVLKTEWMQGTDVYKNAIQLATNALLDYYLAAKNSDPSGFKELSTELAGYITNTLTLYQAQSRGLLTQEDYFNVLGRLGSQYDDCSDLLNAFSEALLSGDELAKEQTASLLLLAIQAALTGLAIKLVTKALDEDVDEDKWKHLSKYLQDNANSLEDVSDLVYKNKEAADELSEAMLRYQSAVDEVGKSYDSWMEALSSDSITDQISAGAELQNVYSDLLDLPFLNLSPDFTQNISNLLLLKQAVYGTEELAQAAYDELQRLALIDIMTHVGLDPSQFYNLTGALYDLYNTIQNLLDDIEIGAYIDNTQAIQSMNEIINAADMTALQATDLLASMGVDALVEERQVPKNQEQSFIDAEPVIDYLPTEVPQVLSDGELANSIVYVPRIRYNPQQHSDTATSTETVTALRVKSARKSSGGGFKINHSTAPATGGSKGGGGGKGGGSKAKAPTQAKTSKANLKADKVKAPYDPYEQVDKQYQRQSDILDDLQDKLKKLVNKDRLKNLQEQNKTLEKQAKILEEKLKISNSGLENTAAYFANQIQQAFENALFDSDGQLADRNALEAQALAKYNADAQKIISDFEVYEKAYNDWIENVYNKSSAEQQLNLKQLKLLRDQLYKDRLKKAQDDLKSAKEVYTEHTKLLDSYEKEWLQQQKIKEELKLIEDQLYENRIAASKIKVDLSIDTGDFERDWLDFENKFIKKLDKDDFLGSAKASAKELMSYFNSNQVQLTANQIKKIRDEINIMNAGGPSDIYGTNLAQAKEDLEEYMSQQMKDLLEVQDMVDNIKDNYLDAIDDAKDKMDEQIDQYERVNDLIDHNVKMVELLYGDKAYDSMLKYYNLQKTYNERELESLKKQQDYWQKKMNNLVVGSLAWEKFKKNLDDVTDNLNNKLEDMIDNLANQFENRVNGIIARLNNALTGGRGLDFLDEQWDYISNYDDNFLDTFETKTGIEEVERLYQSLIDNLVGSPKSQQKLNKLMNDQLKLLREKDHLTEYDLERAKASLEVEKARLALEEARDRKTKMRLRRDSQGNYTYQYVADELKLGDLQAALADAQANLYNTDKLHYKQNLNTLYDTYKDYIEKMRDLTAEYNATQDEEERKRIQGRIDLLKESTAKLMSGLTEDNKYLLNYLNGSFFDGMGTDTSTLTMEEQMEIMKENIPYMQSLIQDLSDTIVGEGGILPATANMMELINKATADYDLNVKNMLTAAGTSLLTIEQAVDKEGNALDKNIINAEKLITTNDKLIKSCQAQIEAMEKLLDYMDKYLNKVMNVLTLLSNLRNAYNTGQGLNGSNLTADEIGMESWGLDTTSGMEYTGNPKTDAVAIKQQIDALMSQYLKFLSAMSIATFDTGGYTGSWGDAEGRLAFLHQGELVLNQDDTMNILNAVQIVRSMASAINGIASGEINSLMSNASGLLGGISNTEQLDQNVHIEANFPNVTQHTLIEQAFENLVNMASMRASRYRD